MIFLIEDLRGDRLINLEGFRLIEKTDKHSKFLGSEYNIKITFISGGVSIYYADKDIRDFWFNKIVTKIT